MPGLDYDVHPSTKAGPDKRWGCWNLPRERNPIMVKDGHFEQRIFQTIQVWKMIEDFGSVECRNDISLTDPYCEGCEWAGSGEMYADSIRRNGT